MDAIRSVLDADPRVGYALVFGSSARGTNHSASDVDIAIGATAGHRLSALDLGDIGSRIESAVGRRVDVVELEGAPPALAYRVFRDGVVVVDRDHGRLAARRARAVLEYLDFRPVEDLFARRVLAAASRGR